MCIAFTATEAAATQQPLTYTSVFVVQFTFFCGCDKDTEPIQT